MAGADDVGPVVLNYFVDEAGTPTLFGRRRTVIVGQESCSNYFILGKIAVDDPDALAKSLAQLREELLANPYFKNVPSLQPERGRTAIAFHAKDDPPEVRYLVFQRLMQHEVSFKAVVRDKHRIVAEVQARNLAEPDYHYRENDLYDDLVSHLFRSGFHEADHFVIRFARRGVKDRTAALRDALEHARRSYERNFGVASSHTVEIIPSSPRESAGLQAADYFLWALQRLYERDEDRYWEFVRGKASLVHDIDDTRKNSYGAFFTPSNPLTRDTRKKIG